MAASWRRRAVRAAQALKAAARARVACRRRPRCRRERRRRTALAPARHREKASLSHLACQRRAALSSCPLRRDHAHASLTSFVPTGEPSPESGHLIKQGSGLPGSYESAEHFSVPFTGAAVGAAGQYVLKEHLCRQHTSCGAPRHHRTVPVALSLPHQSGTQPGGLPSAHRRQPCPSRDGPDRAHGLLPLRAGMAKKWTHRLLCMHVNPWRCAPEQGRTCSCGAAARAGARRRRRPAAGAGGSAARSPPSGAWRGPGCRPPAPARTCLHMPPATSAACLSSVAARQ